MNKHARMMEQVFTHGENLRSIFGIDNIGPVELAKKLHSIEAKAHRLATDECNGVAVPENWEEKTLRTLDKLLGFTEKQIPVFINGDPRGYTLKIDDEYVRAHNLTIYRDFGGYGILAPEFNEPQYPHKLIVKRIKKEAAHAPR